MSLFPLKEGTTIIRLFKLGDIENVEESKWIAYNDFEGLEEEIDVWDDRTSRFILIDPVIGQIEDVTMTIASELPWYAYKNGLVDPENTDIGWPEWCTLYTEFSEAYEAMIEELRQQWN